mgnify:FL=1
MNKDTIIKVLLAIIALMVFHGCGVSSAVCSSVRWCLRPHCCRC